MPETRGLNGRSNGHAGAAALAELGVSPASPPQTPRITIVIPTYNEAANVEALVQELAALHLPGLALLFVDDNSPDGTAALARSQAARLEGRLHVLSRPGKLGLGTAYREGFAWALQQGSQYIIEMDADLSHSPSDIPRMLEQIQRCDILSGSRWERGGFADSTRGWPRRLLSRGGSLYARLLLGLRVKDTTTGFKCFRREVLERLDFSQIKSSGFAFQVEVAYLCQRQGFRTQELPIRFAQRLRGQSKMSLRIILEAFWRVTAIRLRRFA